MSAIAACVMFFMMFTAASEAKKVLEKEQDELAKIPMDEDVVIAEAAEERSNTVYHEITQWERVPTGLKICLMSSVAFATFSCYILFIFNADCFEAYDLLYTIDEHLDGDWTNLILPLGRGALLLFVISMFLLVIFSLWAKVGLLSMSTFSDQNTSLNQIVYIHINVLKNETQTVLGSDIQVVAESLNTKNDVVKIDDKNDVEGDVEILLSNESGTR